MKVKTIYLFIIPLLLVYGCGNPQPAREGVNYYLDAENGDDANSGLSERQAWKSIGKIKEIKLTAGDSLLLRRGTTFKGILEINAKGRADSRVIIDAYGIGKKPRITAPDSSLYTACVTNSDYVTLQNLEVVNTGSEPMPYRTGVKVMTDNYGTSHHIILNALDIHDVNGSLVKQIGGGSGILIESKWKDVVSVFDSLTIEDCTIRRCQRNAIIWAAPWNRKDWHLSTNTVVRKNLIEEVPGDGIVPIGCDGALVEYNLMRNCLDLLPSDQAAAGFWPWSCDNTIIQFNEVSDHKAPWDGQGFDSDYNCTNTTIQYNFSHDNQGGLVLICNAGETNPEESIGNIGTIVQYNISINDAIRTRKTRIGTFSPTIHIAGPCEDTSINNNILHVNVKPTATVDHSIITADSWGGYANDTRIKENVFYAPEPSSFNLTKSTNNNFEGNYYLGRFKNMPKDNAAQNSSLYYNSLIKDDPKGFNTLFHLFEEVEVGDGAAKIKVVKKEAIHDFFEKMKER
ncbi:MAG: right-handed parallel beta-helix repeat-containing protein [Bacteroides sp.]|nr:right-handed parallel beta-helix repeat-containing protein [Bacteroides sp.]